jgi:hypothetical protein
MTNRTVTAKGKNLAEKTEVIMAQRLGKSKTGGRNDEIQMTNDEKSKQVHNETPDPHRFTPPVLGLTPASDFTFVIWISSFVIPALGG